MGVPRSGATDDLVARLSAHRALTGVPCEQLRWAASHGRMLRVEPGDARVDDLTSEGVWIVLSGRFSILVDKGLGPRKVMEWRGGDVSGYLPYSRMKVVPGRVHVEEPGEALMIHRDDFREMIRECHELTSVFVRIMLDRARHFTSYDVHAEKMISLGRLAAGLAHELNNPASALKRSAAVLAEQLDEAHAAARLVGAAGLSPSETEAVVAAGRRCRAGPAAELRSTLEQAAHEDAVAGWLGAHGADRAMAESLADSHLTIGDLDRLAGELAVPALDAALRSVAATCATRKLTSEIEAAAARIHTLVGAVKDFTHMDRAGAPGPVDLDRGLAETITMLRHKARGKSIAVTTEVEADLPRVQAFGGELNQVWMNLIDNALDAAPVDGHVRVRAAREPGAVVVRIVDDGPGIPAEARDSVFDPFFTTKPPGQGTGLGLDIARRLVEQNNGEIDFESSPGRTEFRVTLPVPER